ncbi:MAG: hypothetical protein WCH98_02995 [Verrucomicrobiota bacterium]
MIAGRMRLIGLASFLLNGAFLAAQTVVECPSFSLGFSDDGRPNSILRTSDSKDLIFRREPSPGFQATYSDAEGKDTTVNLSKVSLEKNILTAEQDGIRVDFEIVPKERYIVFRIRGVQEPAEKKLLRLSFNIWSDIPGSLIPLDWMTTGLAHNINLKAEWPSIWGRNANEPAGSFALYYPEDEADEDETLLHLWANEGLPHPMVDGAWTVERARKWLADWQNQFVDQSTMIVQAETSQDLYKLADYAAALGMKKIYMHTDTWCGEYWAVENSFIHVNRDNFPKGEEDLKRFTDYCKSKGLGVAIHTVSCDIGRFDSDYTKPAPDPRLASWARGTLAEPIDDKATVIRFQPNPGVVFPTRADREFRGPNTYPGFMNITLVQIGNEFVEVGAFEDTDTPVWSLKKCQRGFYKTQAIAHAAGQPIKGMFRPYQQAFVADSNSDLLDEVVRRYAEFCNRNGITHMECDGLEIHQDVPWGSRKFAWKVYGQIDHMSTSNTSTGGPLPYHVEYWFNSSAQVKNNHATGGVAGGDGVPLYLHHDERPATGPYEILLKPTQRLGMGGRTFNLISPRAMFGVSLELLEAHGLTAYIENLFKKWQSVAPLVSAEQTKTIQSWFKKYPSPLGEASNQAATDILLRPVALDGKPALVPIRMLGRTGGELNWGWGQEFGPLVPRYYLKPGEKLAVTNPYHSQEPEFLIRVLATLNNESAEAAGSSAGGSKSEEGSVMDSYQRGAGQDKSVHPLADAKHLWCDGLIENGIAKLGKCAFRKEFLVEDPAKLSLAALVLHVDDSAEVTLNGAKIFTGGKLNASMMLDIRDRLEQGKNVLAIMADNYGSEGCLTATVLLEEGGKQNLICSDKTWRSVAKPEKGWMKAGFDESTWKESVELGAFGTGCWGRPPLTPVIVKFDLTPEMMDVKDLGCYQLSVEGKVISLQAANEAKKPMVTGPEKFPHWSMPTSMDCARGIGMTVTGDGSNAILVVNMEGSGSRDYVVKLDFQGPREIEIPTGEVAWANPGWGWRGDSSNIRYGNIFQVRVGLGIIPPETTAHVKIENLRILKEVKTELKNPVFRVGLGSLRVNGTIPSDCYLWFTGGDSIGIYDLNWKKVADLPVTKENFVVPEGETEISIESASNQPWLECQFFVQDHPMLLSAP